MSECTCDDEDVADPRNYSESTDEDGQVTITYYMRGYIDQAQAGAFIDLLHFWHASDNTSNWHIVITSRGGELSHGTAMFSVLRSFSIRGGGTHEVTTRVAGVAASAGALLFEAGDFRVGGDLDMIMIHEPLNTFDDVTATQIETDLYQSRRWVDQLVKILLERSTVSERAIRTQIEGYEWWLTMEDAIEVGLADRIV